jgi:uracil-DNA glycosylase
MNKNQQAYLQAMGIQTWDLQESSIVAKESVAVKTADVVAAKPEWNKLQEQVTHCKLCELYKSRCNTVFGVGNKQADLLFIGEAPGANEDKQGEPFVGRGGKLLTAMLQAIGLKREDVYIGNILKCRPPNNRDPLPSEVATCTPYLEQQIAMLKPKLIIAVGRIAAHFLLDTKESLGRLRSKVHSYGRQQIPLIVTYHPAYLLRSPREKAKAHVDFVQIKQRMDQPI